MPDPFTLLRLAPLITSTTTITYNLAHHIFFTAFLAPSHQKEANAFIPRWTEIWMPSAKWPIVVFYPLSLVLAASNIYTTTASGGAKAWYWAGLVFTFGHFLWAKKAIGLLIRIKDDGSKGKSTKDMREWVKMNIVRGLLTDLPAWMAFLMAAGTTSA